MYFLTTAFDTSQIIPLGIASVLLFSKWFLNISWISFIQVKSLSKRLFWGQVSQNPELTQPLRWFPLESAQERIQTESYKATEIDRELNIYLNAFARNKNWSGMPNFFSDC